MSPQPPSSSIQAASPRVPLELLFIPNPCTVPWESMQGDDKVRFCGECRLHVYNLSEMTRDAAEELVRTREGQLCVRFYRRPDGTVLTQSCTIAARAIRAGRGAFQTLAFTVTAVLSAFCGLLSFGARDWQPRVLPFRSAIDNLFEEIFPTPKRTFLPASQGAIGCVPAPANPPPPGAQGK